MTVRSREQVVSAAARVLNRVGSRCSMSEIARRLEMSRREMYRYVRSASELREAAIAVMIDDFEQYLPYEFDRYGDAGADLNELFDGCAEFQGSGLLECASEELRKRYIMLRLSTLQDILRKGRREGTFRFGDLDTATRLCLHVLDDHSRQLLAFHQTVSRYIASHAGVDVDVQDRAFQDAFYAVFDMLLLALRYVPREEREERQATTNSIAH